MISQHFTVDHVGTALHHALLFVICVLLFCMNKLNCMKRVSVYVLSWANCVQKSSTLKDSIIVSKLADEYPHGLGSDEAGRVGKGRGDRRGNYSGRGQGLHGGMLIELPFGQNVVSHCLQDEGRESYLNMFHQSFVAGRLVSGVGRVGHQYSVCTTARH